MFVHPPFFSIKSRCFGFLFLGIVFNLGVISVALAAHPPTADFTVSPQQGFAPLRITLDASQSVDPDGAIEKYEWKVNGQTLVGQQIATTFTEAGTHTIVLTITDHDGLTSSAQKTVTVNQTRLAPTASFSVSPQQGIAPFKVTLDASQSVDSDGIIVKYEWTVNGSQLTGQTVSTTLTEAINYTIILTVTDNDGLTATAQQTVIGHSNRPPVANFSATPTQGEVPLTAKLDARASSDPDGTITQYNWSTSDGQQATGQQVNLTFSQVGTYTINLVITDNQGKTNTSQQTVIVIAKPKVAPIARLNISPTSGDAPLTVSLNGNNSTDSGGKIVAYQWSASNGQQATGSNAQMSFSQAGTYNITLLVTDNDGMTASAKQTIMVTEKTRETIIVSEPVIVEPSIVEPSSPPILTEPSTVGQAIIIAAGGAQPENTLFEYSNEFTQRMYRLLKERGFSDADIHYLNPYAPDIDLNGYPDDGQSDENRRDYALFDPAQELADAFAQAASHLQAGQQFVFFLHGHANPDAFVIMPDYHLTANQLRDLLATLPADVQQIIILDSCYSGSFFEELAGVEDRILISSADASTLAWNTEYASFTDTFLRSLRRGQKVSEAFRAAEDMIFADSTLFREQRPWLDDDNDGQYTSRDGRRAAQLELGQPGIHAAPPPTISQHPRIDLPDNVTTTTLWVRTALSPDNIRQVRARLINPEFVGNDYQGLATQFGKQEFDLIYNPAQERYERVFDGFRTAGIWRIFYQAQDTAGVWSDIVSAEVYAPGLSLPVTVQMFLNQNRYTAGEKLRLDMEVNGQGVVDLYVAIIFPDGNFQTIAFPLNLSFNNTIQVYQSTIEITAQQTFSIMNLNLPQVPLGPYQTCGVLLWAGEEPNLAQNNWIDIHCLAFDVY
jgi:PKD repeat protein